MTLPEITVGLPTFNRGELLLDTIKQVLSQNFEKLELIVADQSQNIDEELEKSILAISKSDPRLRYFRIDPPNLPAARNFIIENAAGIILLFIDDDIKIKSDFVDQHIIAHAKHKDSVVIAGRVVQKNLPLSDSPLQFDKYGMPQGTFNCPRPAICESFPGGNHSVAVEAIKKVGGYSTAYNKNAVREESDAAFKLKQAGYKMFYEPSAAILHLAAPHGGTRIHTTQFDNPRFYINDLLFALRTVKKRYLPMSLFKRLRIYSGGSVLWPRLKRMVIFFVCLPIAIFKWVFDRRNFKAKLQEGYL